MKKFNKIQAKLELTELAKTYEVARKSYLDTVVAVKANYSDEDLQEFASYGGTPKDLDDAYFMQYKAVEILEEMVELVEGYSFKTNYSNGASTYHTFELPESLDEDGDYEYITYKLRVSDHSKLYDCDLSIDPEGCDAYDFINSILRIRCEFSENN